MAVGRLGAWEIFPSITQSVYKCTSDDATVINVSICNRDIVPTYIRVAITSTENSATVDEYIEYDVRLEPKGVLERTGLVLPANHYVTVRSTGEATSVVLWGYELGEETGDPQPLQNDGTAPVWNTTADLGEIYEGFDMTPIQLDATDPDGASVTYEQTAGTLPTGMIIQQSGTISGFIQEGDAYNAGGVPYTFTVEAKDSRLATPRVFSILRSWAPGTVSDNPLASDANLSTAINTSNQTSGSIYILDAVGNTVETKLFTTNATTGIGGNADYAGSSNTGWALLGSISCDVTIPQSTAGTGSWLGSWTDTNTFGNFTNLVDNTSYKNSLYYDWDYKDILIMQCFAESVDDPDDLFSISTEVAYTSSEWLSTRGSNLRSFFRGNDGPDLRVNGDAGRLQVPVTFLKGSATTSRDRYRSSARGELSETDELDFGIRNNENYRYSMINALGCRTTGANTEHYAWTADVTTNYNDLNYPEPNYSGVWGIDAPNSSSRMTWFIFGTN